MNCRVDVLTLTATLSDNLSSPQSGVARRRRSKSGGVRHTAKIVQWIVAMFAGKCRTMKDCGILTDRATVRPGPAVHHSPVDSIKVRNSLQRNIDQRRRASATQLSSQKVQSIGIQCGKSFTLQREVFLSLRLSQRLSCECAEQGHTGLATQSSASAGIRGCSRRWVQGQRQGRIYTLLAKGFEIQARGVECSS